MINIKLLKKNFNYFKELLKKRNFFIDSNFLKSKEDLRKKFQIEIENLKFKINNISKNISINKNNKDYLLKFSKKVKIFKKKIEKIKKNFLLIKNEINNYYSNIPNIPNLEVPINIDDKKLENISYWGNKKTYNFNIKDYIYIGEYLNELDFKSSSKISGSKFVIMKNKIALIHRALIQFMLDVHINKHNYEEIYVPLIVKSESLYGTGQLPKFSKNIFYIKNKINKLDNSNYCLIPTAEVPLVNIFKDKILLEKNLPIKYVSYTPCFRLESNSYGKNSKGLIKLYQFDKVEIIQIVHPNESNNVLEKITNDAENILKLLNLHYRKRLLCANEMSFSSCKTYDLEVWFPYQNKYIEVSSCSNTTDFQSRRILARYKDKNKNINLVHILNGSGLAVGRTLAAIIENYQKSNLDIEIPNILNPYIKSYL